MENNISYIIAKNILAYLEAKDMSVNQFEEKIGMAKGSLKRAIGKKNSNSNSLSVDNAVRICKELDIPFEKIINDEFSKTFEKIMLERRIAELQRRLESYEEQNNG